AELARVQLPARVERGPLQIAISSGGGAPMLARLVRETLEAQFDESFGALAQLLGRQRSRILARWPDAVARRRAFERLLAGPVPGLLRRRRHIEAGHAFGQARKAGGGASARGHVGLGGGAPGDAGLLTLRALRVLGGPDVILHDSLVSENVLRLARRAAERLSVGKR